jgi:short-subunit dehydrogenase
MCRSSQVDAPQGFQYKRCMKLQGKVAVVTGASMGIGEAVAALFVKEGARVAISSRDLPRAEAARQRIASTDRTLALACDVRRRADLEALLKTTVDRFGRVDIWVNNAGHGLVDSIENMSMADCRAMFDTNLFGAIEAMQLAIAQMKRQGGGTIVNVSSVAGHIAVPYMAAYCATKAALNQMGRAARMELRGTGVNVMTVCPGFVSTSFSANAIKGGQPAADGRGCATGDHGGTRGGGSTARDRRTQARDCCTVARSSRDQAVSERAGSH